MVRHATSTDPSRNAALITTMMLRFPQDTLPLVGTQPPNERGELGATALILMPFAQRLVDDEIVDWFQQSIKPVVATPTYTRGSIAVWSGFTSPSIQHELENQQLALTEYQRQYGLDDDSPVLLDTGAEAVVFPFSHLQEWANNYGVAIGWQLRRASQDGAAKVQLVLIAPGPKRSPGWSSSCEA
jgi:hypothetical protein